MLEITDIIGIIAFAVSGFIVGVKNKLDLLGITIASFLTALGGGVLRDVLASKEIYAFNNLIPGIIVISVVTAGIWLKLHKFDFEKNNIFLISDSIGLVSFSISGAIVGLHSGFNIFGVIFLALITGVGGGMMRDILINQVPFILKENFYGTVSVMVGLYLYFTNLLFENILFILITGIIIRIIAYKKNWKLPVIG